MAAGRLGYESDIFFHLTWFFPRHAIEGAINYVTACLYNR